MNVGCIPKKVLFNCASFLEDLHTMKSYGISGDLKLDYSILKKASDAYIARLNGVYKNMIGNSGVTFIEGHGEFVDANTVKVGDHSYRAKYIIIATGSWPVHADFEGGEHCITSNEVF